MVKLWSKYGQTMLDKGEGMRRRRRRREWGERCMNSHQFPVQILVKFKFSSSSSSGQILVKFQKNSVRRGGGSRLAVEEDEGLGRRRRVKPRPDRGQIMVKLRSNGEQPKLRSNAARKAIPARPNGGQIAVSARCPIAELRLKAG